MSVFSRYLALLTFGCLPAAYANAASSPAPAARPNVLLIVADDLGFADVGFHGSKEIPTPHLDALARRGVICTSGYVTYSVCSPSRAGFITGRYQQRFGYEYNPAFDLTNAEQGLPLTERTLADRLRAAGYATGIVGKWHLGAHPQFHPNRRGFDEFFGFLGGGHRYFPDGPVTIEIAAGRKTSDPQAQAEVTSPIFRNATPVPETGELTARLGEEAANYVTRCSARPQPWFLYLAYNAPHTPMQATPELLQKFSAISDPGRRTYAAMTAALDASIGRVLAALDASGQRARTLVVFFSDNGGPMTKRNANHSMNTPLRGQKGDVFEGGIRVPFLVSWPDRLPAGMTYDQPVSSLDVVPTALAAAGIKLAPEIAATLDGVDLAPFLSRKNSATTEAPPHERLFWRMDGGVAFALREGNWKWMRVRDESPQLYDLAADPGERHDLSAAHPELMQRFAASAADWDRSLLPPRWANNPFGGLINLPGTAKNAQP